MVHSPLVRVRANGGGDAESAAGLRGDDDTVVPEPTRRSSELTRGVPPSDDTLMA
jgi:hypothetical protein